jgi:hypothetical protein
LAHDVQPYSFAGTLMAQLLLVPAAMAIVLVARAM